MKVINLRCSNDHRFEGWFASDDEMNAQLGGGTLHCPLCDDAGITRLPSAPHIVVSGARVPAAGKAQQGDGPKAPAADAVEAPSTAARQAAWLQRLRQVIAQTDDVGDRFASEARRIHYGEAEERAIRGSASDEQVRELLDEGIEVAALPLPAALKGPLQ